MDRIADAIERPDPTDPMATGRQLKFIQAIAREHGMSDDELNNEAEMLYGHPVAELRRREASAYIERLQSRRTTYWQSSDEDI